MTTNTRIGLVRKLQSCFFMVLGFCLFVLTVYNLKITKPIVMYQTYYKVVKPENELYCHLLNALDTLPDIKDVDVKKDENIFFVESSCNSYMNGKIFLKARQACAVESAALMNPNKTVNLLYASPGKFYDDKTESDRLIKNLLTYPNVRILHFDVESFIKQTPAEKLWSTGQIQKSKYEVAHTSDIFRYTQLANVLKYGKDNESVMIRLFKTIQNHGTLTKNRIKETFTKKCLLLVLWKYGGMYLDLDVIVLKSLETLPRNFAGAETAFHVANGVLGFSSTGLGHQHVNSCLYDIADHYDGNQWSINGPLAITRMLYPLCKTKELLKMINTSCQDFHIFPPEAFYSINWSVWDFFFEESKIEYVKEMCKNSYLLHVWNKFSYQTKIPLYKDVPYLHFARRYCPGTVRNLDDYF